MVRLAFMDGEPWQKEWVKHCYYTFIAPHIPQQGTRIVFVDSGTKAPVRLSFKYSGSGTAAVGTDALLVSEKNPTVKLGSLDNPSAFGAYTDLPTGNNNNTQGTTPVHELMHVLSKGHEHLHPDAMIPWNLAMVKNKYTKAGWSASEVEQNIVGVDASSAVMPFDPDSIMMYTISPDLTLNGSSYGPNTVLSEQDKLWLASLDKDQPVLGVRGGVLAIIAFGLIGLVLVWLTVQWFRAWQ
jgi:hypothetical protein